jgi:hypothetical protein
MVQRSHRTSLPSLGPAIDSYGLPVVDPTENVLALVEAAVKRQDDLRYLESEHIREVMRLRASFTERWQQQEAARIDAIRAVDITAVSRAAEVSATQTMTLATQVASAAEAMRVQVAAAAVAAANNLTTALAPIQLAVNELRKSQYEMQGQRVAKLETKDNSQWITVLIIGVVFSVIQIALHFLGK